MIFREIQDGYDRVSIYTIILVSQNLEGFTSFYNMNQVLNLYQGPCKNPIEPMQTHS